MQPGCGDLKVYYYFITIFLCVCALPAVPPGMLGAQCGRPPGLILPIRPRVALHHHRGVRGTVPGPPTRQTDRTVAGIPSWTGVAVGGCPPRQTDGCGHGMGIGHRMALLCPSICPRQTDIKVGRASVSPRQTDRRTDIAVGRAEQCPSVSPSQPDGQTDGQLPTHPGEQSWGQPRWDQANPRADRQTDRQTDGGRAPLTLPGRGVPR